MNIIKSSTSMKSKPSENSSLETECLFGETVKILERYSDWLNCRLSTDNYCGWIKKSDLGKLKKITHRVLAPRTYIYKEANPKSNVAMHLTLGSQLCIEKIEDEWAKTYFLVNNKIKGWDFSENLSQYNFIFSYGQNGQSKKRKNEPYVANKQETKRQKAADRYLNQIDNNYIFKEKSFRITSRCE